MLLILYEIPLADADENDYLGMNPQKPQPVRPERWHRSATGE